MTHDDARDRSLVASILDFYTSFTGALLGAAAGAWISARLAYEQQDVSARATEGEAARLLRASADTFDGYSDTIMRTAIGLVIALLLVSVFRWLHERQTSRHLVGGSTPE